MNMLEALDNVGRAMDILNDAEKQNAKPHHPLIRTLPECHCACQQRAPDEDAERLRQLVSIVLRLSKGIENAAKELEQIQERRDKAA